jgi:hypothetical protein
MRRAPIGDWSMLMILSTSSGPRTRRCAPGRCLARCSRFATALKRISLISVDLPEPDTPVTAQNTPGGATRHYQGQLDRRSLKHAGALFGAGAHVLVAVL